MEKSNNLENINVNGPENSTLNDTKEATEKELNIFDDKFSKWTILPKQTKSKFNCDKEEETLTKILDKRNPFTINIQENKEDVIKSAFTLQSYILRWICARKLEKKREMRYKRELSMLQYIEVELEYNKWVNIYSQMYVNPLNEISKQKQSNSGIKITTSDFSHLFGGYMALARLSDHFVNHLIKESLVVVNGKFNHFCTFSKPLLQIAPFLKMYRSISSRLNRVDMKLDKLKQDKYFCEFLDDLERYHEIELGGHDMMWFVTLPIKIIPKQCWILKDIVKNTEMEHPDYKGLKKALQYMIETSEYMENCMKEFETKKNLFQLSKKYFGFKKNTFKVYQEGRKLIHTYVFRNVTKENPEGKDNKMTIHLFNDVVFISKYFKKIDMFEIISHIPLLHLNVYTYVNDDSTPIRLYIKLGRGFIFMTESFVKGNEFLGVLKRTKQSFKNKCKCNKCRKKFPPKPSPKPLLKEYDIKECLKRVKDVNNPSKMLKYRDNSSKIFKRKPHFRKFHVSIDETKLCWGTKNYISSISIVDMIEIVVGQTTHNFKVFPKPHLNHLSFSILYGKGEIEKNGMWTGKTLDVICENKKELSIWVKAMRFIIADRRWSTTRHDRNSKKKVIRINKIDNDFYSTNDLYSWGNGEYGKLGHQSIRDHLNPKVVKDMLVHNVKKVNVGHSTIHVLVGDGDVWCAGSGSNGQLGIEECKRENKGSFSFTSRSSLGKMKNCFSGNKIISVKSGSQCSLFLDTKGNVWASGRKLNSLFLENNKKKTVTQSPILIIDAKTIPDITMIYLRNSTAAVVTREGHVFTWGEGKYGELGCGQFIPSSDKIRSVVFPKNISISKVSFGGWHGIAMDKNGFIYSFGSNVDGALGFEISNDDSEFVNQKGDCICAPKLIVALKGIKTISCGLMYSCAITKDGSLYSWGCGMFGELGIGSKNKRVSCPQKINMLSYKRTRIIIDKMEKEKYKYIDIECGSLHNLAVVEIETLKTKKKKRELFSWGYGTFGRLGNDSERDVLIPQEVPFFNNKEVISMSAHNKQSAVICKHIMQPNCDKSFNFDVVCMNCNKSFNFIRRRHHCLRCRGVFCKKCCKVSLTSISKKKLCDNCMLIENKK